MRVSCQEASPGMHAFPAPAASRFDCNCVTSIVVTVVVMELMSPYAEPTDESISISGSADCDISESAELTGIRG